MQRNFSRGMKRAASLINASAKTALSLEEPTYLGRINAPELRWFQKIKLREREVRDVDGRDVRAIAAPLRNAESVARPDETRSCDSSAGP